MKVKVMTTTLATRPDPRTRWNTSEELRQDTTEKENLRQADRTASGMYQESVVQVSLLNRGIPQLVLYADFSSRFCKISTLDPIETVTRMPIEVVHSFFRWTFRATSFLQTHWNTFGLMRRKETGCTVLDAEIKR